MKTLRAIIKFLAFGIICILVVPTQNIVMLITRGSGAYTIPYIWQCAVCKIFGLKVTITGTPRTNKQTLFISNHISYLDIPVIGSAIKASFIAKAEVRRWPLLGYLATLQQTAFIERSRTAMKEQKNSLGTMVEDGKSLILFAEGTTGTGDIVRPFKSSLFALALTENSHMDVQPVTLRLKSVNGQNPKENNTIRDLYTWQLEMEMAQAAHWWRFAQTKGAEIELIFHAPLTPGDYKNRKELALATHAVVSNGLAS